MRAVLAALLPFVAAAATLTLLDAAVVGEPFHVVAEPTAEEAGLAWIGLWRGDATDYEQRLSFVEVDGQSEATAAFVADAPGEYLVRYASAPSGWSYKAELSVSVEPCPEPSGRCTGLVVDFNGTDEYVANPERGFFDALPYRRASSWAPVTSSEVSKYWSRGVSTLQYHVVLDAYVEAETLPQGFVDGVEADFETLAAAGLSVIVRFSYTESARSSPPYGDASKLNVLGHIAALKPALRGCKAMVALQAGFIGIWGEWYYTDHFGMPPLSTANLEDRRQVVEALLDALPPDVPLQLRTPRLAQGMLGSDSPIADDQAFDGSMIARLGQHNDCFLADATDMGTYVDPATEYPWLEQQTKWVSISGETCNAQNAHSDCSNAMSQLERFHWSLLNEGYNQDVYNKWKSQGCFEEVRRRLGYRFALSQARFEHGASVAPGSSFKLALDIRNDGFAAVSRPKAVSVVLRHQVTGRTEHVSPRDSVDPRLWLPGPHTINIEIDVPSSLLDGRYDVLLAIAQESFPESPSHSLRMANADGIWDSATGFNSLRHCVDVAGAPAAEPRSAEGGTGSTTQRSARAMSSLPQALSRCRQAHLWHVSTLLFLCMMLMPCSWDT